ncbi:hypothetical protein Goshw_008691, partial [Gossypium schwendimanii]|nr:hypothetical protein [Gossypium schwendimanii]
MMMVMGLIMYRSRFVMKCQAQPVEKTKRNQICYVHSLK